MASTSMSSLPTLEDLHSKAKKDAPMFPNQYLPLETRFQHGPYVCSNPPCVLQTPDKDTRCSSRFYKIFKCSRLKPSTTNYRQLHRQMSSVSSLTSSLLAKWHNWPALRMAIIFMILVSMAVLSCMVISVAFTSPLIGADEEVRQWHRGATFYEIFPASYQDTDSDGYGDFQGIIQRLDYISSLGVTAIRLSSIFSALDYPLEYEHIIDLRSADPHLGRMQDFRMLVRKAHDRKLKVVMELNPTVTSDQHTWALHWQRGIPGYEQFYASANRSKDPPEMEDSDGPPPEDWELTQRTFGGHYVLNWSNPSVQKEYQKMLHYWLSTGVDGFYMKHLEKIHVVHEEDIVIALKQWRHVLDRPEFPWSRSSKKILMASAKFSKDLDKDVSTEALKTLDLLDYPVLVGNGQEMAEEIMDLRGSRWHHEGPLPLWHLGSADTFRLASRVEPRYRLAAFYLLFMLPGSTSVFYGDEIGLRDSYDVFSGRVFRGGQLTPMQWTADNSTGGFTDNMTSPWLPLNPDHSSINVESQKPQLDDFINLIKFRESHQESLEDPQFHELDILEPNVLVLERRDLLLCANFGTSSQKRDFPRKYKKVNVIMSTEGVASSGSGFTIQPGAAFVAKVQVKSR